MTTLVDFAILNFFCKKIILEEAFNGNRITFWELFNAKGFISGSNFVDTLFEGMGLRLPEIGDPKFVGSNLTAIAFFHCISG